MMQTSDASTVYRMTAGAPSDVGATSSQPSVNNVTRVLAASSAAYAPVWPVMTSAASTQPTPAKQDD